MDQSASSFEHFAAERLNRDSERIAQNWVDVLSSQLGVRPRRVLPTKELLNCLPEVLSRASEFLVAPDDEKLTMERFITDDLRELARLRREQGFDVQEVIREFHELAQILDAIVLEWIDDYPRTADPIAIAHVVSRLNRVPLLMGEITLATFRDEEQQSRHASARQLRDFAEMLIHQIKTPLGAAEGAALLLENDELADDPEARRSFAGLIRRNLSRARNIVEDVHELTIAQHSKASAGRFVPLSEILDEVLDELRPLLDEHDVSVDLRGPITDVAVDASRVEIILLNLISNAVKYSDPEAAERWVRIRSTGSPESDAWWIEIADNGLGIPPDVHDKIFDRFVRAHPSRAEGSGLGLSIVWEAVQQLGSEVSLESEPGRGSTFRVRLPQPARPSDPGDESDATDTGESYGEVEEDGEPTDDPRA
ncbi:MAG: HAMP domain-containing sensor histidine kinase [Gemmatimonadota bacterium]